MVLQISRASMNESIWVQHWYGMRQKRTASAVDGLSEEFLNMFRFSVFRRTHYLGCNLLIT